MYTDIPAAYKAFKDKAGYEFISHLNRDQIPKNNDVESVYLTSFKETDTDNEDPVSFGYDIIINYATSPLFNGAVEDFINSMPNYTELQSRKKYIGFKNTDLRKYVIGNVTRPDPNLKKYIEDSVTNNISIDGSKWAYEKYSIVNNKNKVLKFIKERLAVCI